MANQILFLETLFVVVSSTSAVFSSSVVLTAIMFPQMRKRLFFHIIVLISFSDVIGSLASCFGFPANNSALCTAQAILIAFFFKGTWLWTTMLCFQLYSVLTTGIVALSYPSMHLIVWGISLSTTLLPLTTSSFGRQGTNESVQWCFIRSPNEVWYILWQTVDWIAVVIACMLYMGYLLGKLYLMFWRRGRSNLDSRILSVVDSLYLYPLTLVVTWLPTVVANVCLFYVKAPIKDSTYVLSLTACLAMTNGSLLAVVYFWKSQEAKARWTHLLGITGNVCCTGTAAKNEGVIAITSSVSALHGGGGVHGHNSGGDVVASPSPFPEDFQGAEKYEYRAREGKRTSNTFGMSEVSLSDVS